MATDFWIAHVPCQIMCNPRKVSLIHIKWTLNLLNPNHILQKQQINVSFQPNIWGTMFTSCDDKMFDIKRHDQNSSKNEWTRLTCAFTIGRVMNEDIILTFTITINILKKWILPMIISDYIFIPNIFLLVCFGYIWNEFGIMVKCSTCVKQ